MQHHLERRTQQEEDVQAGPAGPGSAAGLSQSGSTFDQVFDLRSSLRNVWIDVVQHTTSSSLKGSEKKENWPFWCFCRETKGSESSGALNSRGH